MSKKILCFILALLLTANCLMTVSAAEYGDDLFATVTVWKEQYRQLQVIPKGADLLFSAEDLAWMSGMEMTQGGNLIRFARGFKTVTVQLIDPDTDTVMPGYEEVVSAMVSTNTKNLISPAQRVDGTWYLSGASLLPWMNTQVLVDDNKIMVRPAPDSLWDHWDSFSLDDYTFDFVACCQEMGINSKDVEAAAYFRNNGLKSLLDLDINNNGTTYQSTQNYNDLFDDFFLDKSATDQAHTKTKETLEAVINATDAVTMTLQAAATEFSVITEAASKVLNTGKMFLDFYTYVSLFNEDNEQKLRIMDNFVGELIPNSVSLDKNMKKAANQTRERYRELWKGVMQKALSHTVDSFVGELNSNVVMQALDLKWRVERPLNQKIDRIRFYDTIASYAKHAHNEGFGGYSEGELDTVLDNSMLYLYCVEQNYRAMAEYIQKKGVGTKELQETYISRADAAENAMGLLLHLSLFSSYDASDTGKWSTMSKELLKGFEGLEREHAVVSDLGITVDNAIMAAGMLDMDLQNLRWTQADMDRDGLQELLAICDENGETTCFVMDANNKAMSGINFSSMVSGYCALLPTSDGASYHPTYGLERGEIFSWSGHEWVSRFSWGEGWEEEKGEMVFKDYFYCDGTQCDYATYSQRLEAAKIQDVRYEDRNHSLELDSPQIYNQLLEGDPDRLIRQLDNHMKAKDKLLAAVDVNFDLDDDTDRMYIIDNALSQMLLFARMNDPDKEMPYHGFIDMEWTLVLAERKSNGVLLRLYRVDERYLEDMTVADCVYEGEVLSIGENDFYYSEYGEPFIDAESYFEMMEPCLVDFLDMSEEDALSYFEDIGFREPGAYAEGSWEGGYLSMGFATDGNGTQRVADVIFWPGMESDAKITMEVNASFNRTELWEQIQPSTPWPEIKEAADPSGNVGCYSTTFAYTQNGIDYWFTLCFLTDAEDERLLAIGIVPKM